MSIYYVYAYLRSKDSTTAPAGTPYYIGKGSNGRAYRTHRHVKVPDRSSIVFLETNLSENKAFEIEKFLIAYYGRKDNGTGILLNRTDGGEGTSGYIATEETRTKLSEAGIGEKNPFYGKRHSKETIRKLREARMGKTFTEETIQKMSDAKNGEKNPLFGKHHSEESKAKMAEAHCGEKSAWFGKQHSDETKQKMAEARKEYWRKRREAKSGEIVSSSDFI